MLKEQFLEINRHIITGKTVLDLACHDGESSGLILAHGAKHLYGVDIRAELISNARTQLPDNSNFFVGDITDVNLIAPLVEQSQTVVFLGALYHLFDHFRFFSNILKPNIEYVLIETLFGPESPNPEMYWGFEPTSGNENGWHPECNIIPNGTPNISWILNVATIFGFACDWYTQYFTTVRLSRNHLTHKQYLELRGSDWPSYHQIIDDNFPLPEHVLKNITDTTCLSEERMIFRLYNKRTIDSNPLGIDDLWRWNTSVWSG